MNKYQSTADLKSRARVFLTGKYASFAMTALFLLLASVLLNNFFSVFLSALYRRIPLFQNQIVLVWIVRMIFSFFLGILITNVVPGVCLFCLKTIKQIPTSFNDLFYAYRNETGKFFTVSAILTVPRLVFMLPFNIYYDRFGSGFNLDFLYPMFLSLAAGLILTIPVDFFYVTIYFLMLDFPHYTAWDAFAGAFRIIKEHRQKLLYMELSFLPVVLLCFLSLGIGLIWAIPYIAVTYSFFYLDIMSSSTHS